MGGVGSHAIFQQRWEDKFPAGGRQGELGRGGGRRGAGHAWGSVTTQEPWSAVWWQSRGDKDKVGATWEPPPWGASGICPRRAGRDPGGQGRRHSALFSWGCVPSPSPMLGTVSCSCRPSVASLLGDLPRRAIKRESEETGRDLFGRSRPRAEGPGGITAPPKGFSPEEREGAGYGQGRGSRTLSWEGWVGV